MTAKDRLLNKNSVSGPNSEEILHIEINIGFACNNMCIFCLSGGARKFEPDETIRKEAAAFRDKGYNSIGFVGGEPTIKPGIIPLVQFCKDIGYRNIIITTNGRRLSDDVFLQELLDAGVTRFTISIHSHREDVENHLAGNKNSFQEKTAGLKNLSGRLGKTLDYNQVALNIVMNKKNLLELDRTLEFFALMGIKHFRLLIIRPEQRAFLNFDELVPSMTELRKEIPRALKMVKKHNLELFMDKPPFCLFYDIPKIRERIAEDVIDDVVTLSHETTRETFSWKERQIKRIRVKAETCAECYFDAICDGVWVGYVEKAGFEEFKPVSKDIFKGS